MNINQKRARIREFYGEQWKRKVDKMTDAQVAAVFLKFLLEGKIK